MKHFHRSFLPVLLVVTALFVPASVSASDVLSHASNVFKFQQKLAMKGNPQAQYKLGFMYETGEGVAANMEQALHWYERAAKAGLKAAEHRNTYLMVKEQGYNRDVHLAWLNSVKADVSDHNADAMLLLGQLYRQGLGVKKDLNKSLELLTQVSVLGTAEVEDEIETIQAEMTAAKKSKAASRASNKRVTSSSVQKARLQKVQASKTPAKVVKVPAVTKQQKSEAQILAAKKAAIKAEKKRKYEAVMKQLQREQQLIDEQQSWSTGGEVATVDDEI